MHGSASDEQCLVAFREQGKKVAVIEGKLNGNKPWYIFKGFGNCCYSSIL